MPQSLLALVLIGVWSFRFKVNVEYIYRGLINIHVGLRGYVALPLYISFIGAASESIFLYSLKE